MPPLFLYGTLLDPRILAAQSGLRGLSRSARPARLAGWARVTLRGTPYPTLFRQAGAETTGAVVRVGPQALRRLAAYEGPSYRLVPVRVAMAGRGQARRARAWVAPPWRAAAGLAWVPPRGKARRAGGARP